MTHTTRPLPDPSTLPYGVVRLTVWQTADFGGGKSGRTYLNHGDHWANSRNLEDHLHGGDEVDWTVDGFRFDYFNRGYLLQEDQNTDPLVLLALWALERWAQDRGLISERGES